MKVFSAEPTGAPDWAGSPDNIKVYLTEELFARIPAMCHALKDVGLHKGVMWVDQAYEFFEEGSKFDPEYRVEGCYLVVFSDGTIGFEFPLRDHPETLWTGVINPESAKDA